MEGAWAKKSVGWQPRLQAQSGASQGGVGCCRGREMCRRRAGRTAWSGDGAAGGQRSRKCTQPALISFGSGRPRGQCTARTEETPALEAPAALRVCPFAIWRCPRCGAPPAPAAAVPAGSSLLQQPWWITGIAQPVHGNMGSGTRRVGGASGARCQPCRGTRVPAASSTPADRMHHALASFVARKPLQVSLSVPTSFPVAEPGAACCAQRSQLLPDTIASHQVQACPAHRWRCPDGLQQVRLSSQGLATGAIPCARGILPH